MKPCVRCGREDGGRAGDLCWKCYDVIAPIQDALLAMGIDRTKAVRGIDALVAIQGQLETNVVPYLQHILACLNEIRGKVSPPVGPMYWKRL